MSSNNNNNGDSIPYAGTLITTSSVSSSANNNDNSKIIPCENNTITTSTAETLAIFSHKNKSNNGNNNNSDGNVQHHQITHNFGSEYVRDVEGRNLLLDQNGNPITISRLLATKPLRADLSSRPGPGNQRLTYMSGDSVTRTLNEIFGFDGWNMELKNSNREECVKDEKGRYHVCYSAHVRLTHRRSGAFKEDCGAGDAIDRSLGNAITNAIKASVTDALKRAARHFGDKLGNSCYQSGFSINKAPNNLKQALQLQETEQKKLKCLMSSSSTSNNESNNTNMKQLLPSPSTHEGTKRSSSSSGISKDIPSPPSITAMVTKNVTTSTMSSTNIGTNPYKGGNHLPTTGTMQKNMPNNVVQAQVNVSGSNLNPYKGSSPHQPLIERNPQATGNNNCTVKISTRTSTQANQVPPPLGNSKENSYVNSKAQTSTSTGGNGSKFNPYNCSNNKQIKVPLQNITNNIDTINNNNYGRHGNKGGILKRSATAPPTTSPFETKKRPPITNLYQNFEYD